MTALVTLRHRKFDRKPYAREPRRAVHTSKYHLRFSKYHKPLVSDFSEAFAGSSTQDVSKESLTIIGQYVCGLCLEEFPMDNATLHSEEALDTCAAHVYCNGCIRYMFDLAMKPGWDYFPVRCCSDRRGVDIYRCLHILDWKEEKVSDYKEKTAEYMKMTLRPDEYVTCGSCGAWKPGPICYASRSKDRPVLKCLKVGCDFTTCVLCKTEWKLGHLCGSLLPPDWLPKYTSLCRIKRCPGCNIWVQHVDACNHMICSRCRFSFCFVCRTEWNVHDSQCVPYGDPEYDEEGYEVGTRGLHRYTGLNRQGFDRRGHAPQQLRDSEDTAHYECDDPGLFVRLPSPVEETLINPGPDSEPDSDENEGSQDNLWDHLDEWEDDTDLDELQDRIDAHGVICRHSRDSWRQTYAIYKCPICNRQARDFFSQCRKCHIGICHSCNSIIKNLFKHGRPEFKLEEYRPRKANAIQAEFAYNPSLRYIRSLFGGDPVYERQVHESSSIRDMMGEVVRIVVFDEFGIPGVRRSFRYSDSNLYAPLSWEENQGDR